MSNVTRYIHDLDLYNYDVTDKEENRLLYSYYILTRISKMFRWHNLPDTVPEYILELYLQRNGCCAFTKVDGEYRIFFGGLGGTQDIYYRSTLFTVGNPKLKQSLMLEIDKDCVLMKNDPMLIGLLPVINKYANMLVENDITTINTLTMMRPTTILTTPNESTKKAGEEYLKQISDGNLGIMLTKQNVLGEIGSIQTGSIATNALSQCIEHKQYTLASLYNELGLQSNYNMKRESINSNEAQLNEDILRPLPDVMLEFRKIACDEINRMYGLNISVEFDSSWKENQIMINKSLEGDEDGMEENKEVE